MWELLMQLAGGQDSLPHWGLGAMNIAGLLLMWEMRWKVNHMWKEYARRHNLNGESK